MDQMRNELRIRDVMRCGLFISVWITVFLLEHTMLHTGSAKRSCHRYSGREFMVIPTETDLLVFSEDDYLDIGITIDDLEQTNGYWIRVFLERSTGPIPGILEWYRTTSYMPDAESLSIAPLGQTEITSTQQDAIYWAIVDHAWADPNLAAMLPGEQPLRTFEPELLTGSLLSAVLYCSFPTLAAWIASSVKWRETLGARFESIPEGHCTSCGYDCRGLPTSICPECGNESRIAHRELHGPNTV